jgi:hypothetical protein
VKVEDVKIETKHDAPIIDKDNLLLMRRQWGKGI